MPNKPPRLSIEQFKERAKEVGPDFRAIVPKAYSAEVEKASGELEGDRRLQFTISTGSVDRHEDTVNPEGCSNLKSFQKTGVVLWAHDSYLPPIGKPIKAWSEDGKVKSVAEFSPPDLDHPLGRGFGSTVFRYFVEQYLKSVSIGFLSSDWQWSEERDWGIDFNKWELLEFSPVPIPANKEALVELAKGGEDLKGIFQWAGKCLDTSPSGLLVPRKDIEEVYYGLRKFYSLDSTSVDLLSAEALLDDPIDEQCKQIFEEENKEGTKENEHLPLEYREKLEQFIQTKKGRVLSAKNEKRLRDAFALIGEVLEQLAEEDEAEDEPEEEGDDKAIDDKAIAPPITRELVTEALQSLVSSDFIQSQTDKAIKETLDRRAGRLPATTD
jgi:hypothetical protein